MNRTAFALLPAILMACSGAFALPLNTDPAAISGTTGLSHYSATVGSKAFSCEVVYAAYETANYSGYDPSWGHDKYLYAYQIFNSGNSNVFINTFMVNMLAATQPHLIAFDGAAGVPYGLSSSSQEFMFHNDNKNAVWRFGNQPVVGPARHSVVLVFTSDNAPSMSTAKVSAGDFAGVLNVVAPHVPEPTTAALLCGGAYALLRRRFAKN